MSYDLRSVLRSCAVSVFCHAYRFSTFPILKDTHIRVEGEGKKVWDTEEKKSYRASKKGKRHPNKKF